jgi:hypothetical protein
MDPEKNKSSLLQALVASMIWLTQADLSFKAEREILDDLIDDRDMFVSEKTPACDALCDAVNDKKNAYLNAYKIVSKNNKKAWMQSPEVLASGETDVSVLHKKFYAVASKLATEKSKYTCEEIKEAFVVGDWPEYQVWQAIW